MEGEYVRVAAPFAGELVTLSVRRGQAVKVGDPLFTLEQENEAAARDEAAERLRRAEAQWEDLKKGKRATEIEAIEAQLSQAEAQLRLSEAQIKRQERLVASRFASRETLDEVRAARDRDRARIAELTAELETARLAAREDEVRAAEAEVAAAKAALAQADWRLGQKSVRSPSEALVTDTLYVQGEWVSAGSPVVELLPPKNIKLRFFVPEPELGAIQLHQPVSVTCDGGPAHIAAHITYIAPEAEYTPPVIYSRESREKLVFLVEAYPSPEDAVRLHPGQPVEVRVLPQ